MITENLVVKIRNKEEWDKVGNFIFDNSNYGWANEGRPFTNHSYNGQETIEIDNGKIFSPSLDLVKKNSPVYTADQFLKKYGRKFKVGDRVVITNTPKNWASLLCPMCPINLLYPQEVVIEEIKDTGDHISMRGSIGEDNYGFNLSSLINENNIKLVEKSTPRWIPIAGEELKDGDIIKLEGKFIYKTEDPRDGNVGGVKKAMSRVRSFIKNLTLSSEDKLLREYGFQNECGDYTDDARELVISKLVADNKAYIVEIAQGMKKEDEERNEKK